MLKIGKLDSELLKKAVFDKIKYRREEILTRPGIGEDCAEIDFGEYICTMSTDPITASVKDIGRLAIHVTCNDIASNGISPVGIMLAVMLPVGTEEEDVEYIMNQAAKAAEEVHVEIIGGHTEITKAVNKPVIVSTAIGIDLKSRERYEIEEGDLIFVTKTCGLEGTGIIVSDMQEDIKKILTEEEISKALLMLNRVSVVDEGVTAGRIGVCKMHDVTEGGILGAVWELCHVAELGAEIKKESIPVDDITKKVCSAYDIDPLRLISSGSMLVIARPDKKKELEEKIEEISCIGSIREKEYGIRMDGEVILPPETDELYKAI